MKSIKNSGQFTHQVIEDKYNKTIVLPHLEEKKKRLKEIREYMAFNAEEITEHEKQYLEQKEMASSRRSEVKEEWHYKAPPKSQRL